MDFAYLLGGDNGSINGVLNIENIESDYLINIGERLVVSANAFEYEGTKYYMLEQMETGLYNVQYNSQIETGGDFEVSTQLVENKYKVTITLKDNKYVSKWQVRYKLEGTDYWETSDSLSFTVSKYGNYDINVIHGDEIDLGTKTVNIVRPGLKVGDYVDYVPDVSDANKSYNLSKAYSGYNDDQVINQENCQWQILNIQDDGTVDLLANPTNTKMFLGGSVGYNNGVYLLHDICEKLYSNSNLGVIARSINMADIEKYLTEDGKNAKNNYNVSGIKYGEKITSPLSFNSYPSLYAYEIGAGINTDITVKNGIDINEKTATGYNVPTEEGSVQANIMTATQTFYSLKFSESCNSQVVPIISNTNKYWVASRFANCLPTGYIYFGLYNADIATDGCFEMHNSGSSSDSNYYSNCIRPIVSIKLNIEIKPCNGTNSETNMHIISNS